MPNVPKWDDTQPIAPKWEETQEIASAPKWEDTAEISTAPQQIEVSHPSGEKRLVHPSEIGAQTAQGFAPTQPNQGDTATAALMGLRDAVTGTAFKAVAPGGSLSQFKNSKLLGAPIAIASALTGGQEPSKDPYTPQTGAEKIAYVATNLADPAGNLVGAGAASLAGKALARLPWARATEALARSAQYAKAEAELGREAAGLAYEAAARKYLMNRFATDAGKLGAEFGAFEGAREAANAALGADVDPVDAASHVAKAFGLGVVAGPVATLGRAFITGDKFAAKYAEKAGNFTTRATVDAEGSAAVKTIDNEIATIASRRAKLLEEQASADVGTRAKVSAELEKLDGRLAELDARRSAVNETVAASGMAKADDAYASAEQARRTLREGKISATASEQLAAKEELRAIQAEREQLQKQLTEIEERAAKAKSSVTSSDVRKADKLRAEIAAARERQFALTERAKTLGITDALEREGVFVERELGKLEKRAALLEYSGRRAMSERASVIEKAAAERAKRIQDRIAKAEARQAALEQQLQTGQRPLSTRETKSLVSQYKSETRRGRAIRQKTSIDYNVQMQALENQADALAAKERELLSQFNNPGQRQHIAAKLQELEFLKASHERERAVLINAHRQFIKESAPIKLRDLYAKQRFIENASAFARQKVQRLVERGVIGEHQADGLAAELLIKLSRDKGLQVSGKSAINSFMENAMLPLEVLSAVDKKHGTMLTRVGVELIMANARFSNMKEDLMRRMGGLAQSLVEKGLKPEDITYLLTHTESSGGVAVFNPLPAQSKALTRDAYNGAAGDPATLLQRLPELGELRLVFNEIREMIPGLENRNVAAFVPLRKVSAGAALGGGNVSRITEPGFMLARQEGRLIPGQHETDIFKLITLYSDEVSRKINYEPLLGDLFSEVNKAFTLGDRKGGNYLIRLAADTMSLGGPKELSDKFAGMLLDHNQAGIRELLGSMADDPSVIADLYAATKSVMYQSLVVANPKNLLLNYVQPEMIASAEVGISNIEAARKALMSGGRLAKLAKDMENTLTTADFGALEEVGFSYMGNKTIKNVEKIATLSLRPAKAAFALAEKTNRKTTFLAGYIQAEAALADGSFMRITESLLPGERAAVLHALETKGQEAAKQLYGVIRSYRANFAYSVANRPQILRHGLGKHVPFVTWGVNQMHRLVYDVKHANVGQLARRVAYPLVATALWRGFTNTELKGANPVDPGNLISTFRWKLMPTVTDTAEAMAGGYNRAGVGGALAAGAGQALMFTPYGPARKIYDRLEKGKSATAAVFGAEDLDEDRFTDRVIPKWFRENLP